MIQTLGEFCEAAGLPWGAAGELVRVLADQHTTEVAMHKARTARCAARPDNEALPLMEDGHEFGRVEARIPGVDFFNWLQKDGFGWEGITSEEGMRDILRDNPVCRVRTVSGRITSGWTPGRRTVKNYG